METRKSLRRTEKSPPPPKKSSRKKLVFVLGGVVAAVWIFQGLDEKKGDVIFSAGTVNRERGKGENNLPGVPAERTIFFSADDSGGDSLKKDFFDSAESQAGTESLRTIRIAAWNLDPLDYGKVTDRVIGGRIAETAASFDLVAISGFRAPNRGVVDGLLYRMNRLGTGRFDSAVPQTPHPHAEFQAFIFNRDRIRIDRDRLYEIMDPRGRLRTPPLVGSFCAVGPAPTQRFTWTLISVRINPETSPPNPEILADIYRTVRQHSGRGGISEDDLILLGSFEAPIEKLGSITTVPDLVSAAADLPTDSAGRSVDHLIFNGRATTEYVEKFGIVNLAERFGISAGEANKIAGHSPIWADFSVMENF